MPFTYVPHSDEDRKAMLEAIGVKSVEELFRDVPEHARFPELNLPPAISEMEVRWEVEALAAANFTTADGPCFLGAGAYRHYVPAVVDTILRRGEFYTAYTPYQPEISQGTLQAIFEYQTMICDLTGMEVSNASHYDGATATAEAVITAINVHRLKRKKIVVSPWVHPEYRAVVRTYTQGMGLTIVGDEGDGSVPVETLLDAETACLIVQYPNFLGQIEDLRPYAEAAHAKEALLVVVADPIALGMLKPPGEFGADIVVGEGQSMGAGLNFGGPYLGFFATRMEHVRRMAGRLVGQTVDAEGKRGFVLTLSTREQHIRREKATSNICTNQGLVALAAAVYMAALGRCGMRRVAELCYHKAHYAADQIDRLEGYTVLREKPFFKEFVVRCPRPVSEINRLLLDEWGIIGGYDLGRDYPHLKNHMLVCVTEMNPREEIDLFVEALEEIAQG
ncbi:MAG: aminomethyl-transferring glycine dehydrogenase subunit GcvPA [Anaerolineae bacterium]|nr:aminomethyl-transferring glycine dehydrogenase subunit GcvPA [Anaerolineae bacterium]MCX8067133.1 aminomethyl-transferring glycine dehydrogenase subunit GcvPA [Anaerolineae bacterium]MDW7991928.1 aminomethyl-transferring glycine dehydrogenase subunit GcvPA [Anaerolineae bacterium]